MAVELKGNILHIHCDPTSVLRSLMSYKIEVFDHIYRLKARNSVLQSIFQCASLYCLYSLNQKIAFFVIWKKHRYAQAVPVLTYRDKFNMIFSFVPYSKELNKLFSYLNNMRLYAKLSYREARELLFLPHVIETLCYLFSIPRLIFNIVLMGEYKLLWQDNTVVVLFTETPLIDKENIAYHLTPIQFKIFFLISHFRERLFDILTPELINNPLIRPLIHWSSKSSEILRVLL